MPQVLLYLAAPITLCAGIPAWGFGAGLLFGAAAALLGVAPLLHALGPAWPRRHAYVIVALGLAVVAAFLFTPPGAVLVSSDLAGGAIVLALFAGVLGAAMIRVRA